MKTLNIRGAEGGCRSNQSATVGRRIIRLSGRRLQMADDFVLDPQTLLFEFFQFVVTGCIRAGRFGLDHLGVSQGVFVDQ